MSNVLKLFNSKDEKELKQSLKEVVVSQFRTEIEELDMYLFDPKQVEDLISEMYQEIIVEVRQDVKKKLTEKIFSSIDSISIDKLLK